MLDQLLANSQVFQALSLLKSWSIGKKCLLCYICSFLVKNRTWSNFRVHEFRLHSCRNFAGYWQVRRRSDRNGGVIRIIENLIIFCLVGEVLLRSVHLELHTSMFKLVNDLGQFVNPSLIRLYLFLQFRNRRLLKLFYLSL